MHINISKSHDGLSPHVLLISVILTQFNSSSMSTSDPYSLLVITTHLLININIITDQDIITYQKKLNVIHFAVHCKNKQN